MFGRSSATSSARRRQQAVGWLFAREAKGTHRLLLLIALSGTLMALDQNTLWLKPLRSTVGTALSPLEFAAHAPYKAAATVSDWFASRTVLNRQVAALERENRELHAAGLRYDAVARENDRLRALFNSQAPLRYKTLIAELIGLSVEPKEVTLDKGSRHGVSVGQPVIDAAGLFGQVVETTAVTSRVLLVTDPSHAVPVYVLRNGVRAIAVGDGVASLTLKYAAPTMDIRVGDTLACSGLGGRFPRGYPVGVVASATQDSAEPFLRTTVRPSAALDRSRHLLVLLANTPAANTPAANTPAANTPAANTPAANTPATNTPAANTPAANTPAANTPATNTPAAGTEPKSATDPARPDAGESADSPLVSTETAG